MNAVIHLPAIQLSLNGQAVEGVYAQSLVGVRVHQRLNLPTQLLARWELDALPGSLPATIGSSVQLKVAADRSWDQRGQGADFLFAGKAMVMDQERLPDRRIRITMRAYDKLHDLRMRSQVNVFSQTNLQDVANELASACGLKLSDSPSGPQWPQLFQLGESHYDFLLSIAARCGEYLYCHGDELRLFTLNGTGTTVQLQDDQTLRSFKVSSSAIRATSAVNVQAWNTHRGEETAGEASQARTAGGTNWVGAAGAQGDLQLVNFRADSAAESSALAQAALDERSAQQTVMSGHADGNPAMLPGTRIELVDLAGEGHSAVLTEVVHRIDPTQGYCSEFNTKPPAMVSPLQGPIFTMAEVTRVNDPETLGRVRVKLSGIGDCETEWLPVLMQAAGDGKGIIALPDVGDRVLVLMDRANPTQAIVLGAFFAPTAAPESGGVVGNAVKQFHFLTPGGHHIALDDANTTLTLTHSGGSKLEFAPGGTTLSSLAKLVIEAKGCPVEIKGSKIDMNYG